MKLRPYQTAASHATLAAWKQFPSALVVMPTGTGKTVLFSDLIRRIFPRKALVLAHRSELIHQAKDKIQRVTGYRVEVEMADLRADLGGLFSAPQVIVSSIQTQTAGGDGGGRMAKFDPAMFGALIIDECFPAGTLIDGRPIESFVIGDPIQAFDHASGHAVTSRVTRTFKSVPSALLSIRLRDGRRLICTPGHPFYRPELGRYAPAIELSPNSLVLTHHERTYHVPQHVSGLWRAICRPLQSCNLFAGLRAEAPESIKDAAREDALRRMRHACHLLRSFWSAGCPSRPRLLFADLPGQISRQAFIGTNGEYQPEVCLGPDEGTQSNEEHGCSRQGLLVAEIHGMAPDGQDGQWPYHGTPALACLGVGLADGSGDPDHAQRQRLSDRLQGGHRQHGVEDCRGGGWVQSLLHRAQGAGRQEGCALGLARVECVEILEPGCDGRFGGLCPDGFVYNLEVARYHNYFAEGVLVHNCHHATAASYRRVIDYYRQNPRLKVLGVTATPDRADEEALGQVFEHVAFDYEILDAIHDGWLVPIEQQSVEIEGLDFSGIRTTAGDLNGADLAAVMEAEKPLHGIADATLRIAKSRRTLVFAASVHQAEMLADIFNRHRPGCAGWVCGKTDKVERAKTLADFAQGHLQFVVNVGVLTEGFDDPGVEVVVMGRPTKSRALYAQMCGRALRPLPGVVDEADDSPEHRRAAIAASAKPSCLIVDFAGNAGRHKLVSTADILGGNVSEEAVARAAERARQAGKPVRMDELLDEAEEERLREREEQKRLAAARKANLVAKASFTTQSISPFDLLDLRPAVERGWDRGREISPKMRAMIEKHYPDVNVDQLTFAQARQLSNELFRRWDGKLATYKQVKLLARYGIDAGNMTLDEATAAIDVLAKNGWRKVA